MSEEPNKTSGQFHSAKGTTVEALGNVTGSESWQQSGKKEHTEGETEYKAAQASGYVQGLQDQVSGMASSVTGAFTGDKAKQAAGNIQSDKGKAQQDLNKP